MPDTVPETKSVFSRPYLWAALLFLLTLVVFAPTCTFPFVNWDDSQNAYLNPYLNPVNSENLRYLWTHSYFELYTPVTYSIWAFCAALGKLPAPIPVPGGGSTLLDARIFHLVGVVLHAVNVVLVYGVLRVLIGRPALSPGTLWVPSPNSGRGESRGSATVPESETPIDNSDSPLPELGEGTQRVPGERAGRPQLPAFLGALLFALHPLQVESVSWVTGNNNIFSGLFCLLALYLLLRKQPVWATVAFTLALLSKPTAAALPFMVFVIYAFWLRRPLREYGPLLLVWLGLTGACMVITRLSSETSATVHYPLWKGPLIALDALTFYTGKLLFPLSLGVDYGRTYQIVLSSAWTYGTAIVALTGLVLCVLRWRCGQTLPLAAVGLFIAGALPMMGLVPFYFQIISTVTDRYLYLSMLGPSLALAVVVARFPRLAVYAGVAVVLCLFTVKTISHQFDYQSGMALFSHALVVNPTSVHGHNNLANALADKGKPEEALKHTQEAVRLAPDNPEFLNNLGLSYGRSGRAKEGIPYLQKAVALKPEYAEAHYHLGLALQDVGDLAGAETEFLAAIQADSKRKKKALFHEEMYFQLAITLGKRNKPTEAVAALDEVLRIDPKRGEAYFDKGVLLGNMKRDKEALAALEKAVECVPNDANGHYSLGRIQERLGDHVHALASYKEATRLAPDNPKFKEAYEKAEKGANP